VDRKERQKEEGEYTKMNLPEQLTVETLVEYFLIQDLNLGNTSDATLAGSNRDI
jgi:hypothetical protein